MIAARNSIHKIDARAWNLVFSCLMTTIDGAFDVANRLMRLFKDSIKANRSLWLVSFLLIPISLVALVKAISQHDRCYISEGRSRNSTGTPMTAPSFGVANKRSNGYVAHS